MYAEKSDKRNWQELCDAISKERDPEQLMALISDLLKALDERKATAKNKPPAKPNGVES
jgi:hypothetical protein